MRARVHERPALLFGATSIVGFALARLFGDRVVPFANPYNATAAAKGWRRVKIEDGARLNVLLGAAPPDLVIYCHAVCDVAKCEADPSWARDINVGSIDNLIALLPQETRSVYVSSDHVFGGDGAYAEDSAPAPISVYGRTRVAAEERVLARYRSLVIRAGLPIGPSVGGRTGHMDWLRYRHRKGLPITIIEDEYRSAVWADDLALRIMALAESSLCGLRHIPARRAVSRPELASFIAREIGLPIRFAVQTRRQQPFPHLGRVEIQSRYADAYAAPLASAVDGEKRWGSTDSFRSHG